MIERSAQVGIPLRVRISGPCTFSGTSGRCFSIVTATRGGLGPADEAPLRPFG